MLEFPRPKPTSRVRQLEWPQEVARLLEIHADGDDLMNQIFHADDAEFAEMFLDYLIVGQGDSLTVDLSISALIDQVTDCLY